ncbi:RING finger and WD repeat domain-containing protein 3 [Coemansia sp. RSA 1085]|nr:RING finger and WD repeat domain-containing protein 3 [Coemansia sp. RSA 1085]
MGGGTDAELSQSASPPSLSQVLNGAFPQHTASCGLSRNGSAASMQSVESSRAGQTPDTGQATEGPHAVAETRERAPKRLRTEQPPAASTEAQSSEQARHRRPGIAHERQSRFFSSSESLQQTESEGASAASDGQECDSSSSSSDSDDFAQPAAPPPPPPPPPQPKPKQRPPLPPAHQQGAQEAEDCNSCSICMEPWTVSGPHRVVSLKCGHLYGQACAKKWLRRASQKRAQQAGAAPGSRLWGKCPECNQRADWKDIRPIYARSIVAVDSQQVDQLARQLRELRDAKLRLEDEHRQLCTKYSEMRNEVARVRRELDLSFDRCRWLQAQNASLLRQAGASSPHAAAGDAAEAAGAGPPGPLPCARLRAAIPVASQEGEALRVLAVHPHEPLLFASYSKPALRLHTLAQIDVYGAGSRAFLLDLPHEQEIRGAKVSPHAAGTRFLLTASLDQTAAVSALGSPPAAGSSGATRRAAPMLAARLNVNAPCWACEWDAADPNLCYVGTARSRVLAFDLRRADVPVHTWDGPRDAGASQQQGFPGYSPIHGIVALPAARHGGRLLVANSNGLFALPPRSAQDPQARSWTPVAPAHGSSRACYSLSYDEQLDCIAASYRSQDPATGLRATEHELYGADPDTGCWQKRRPCISVLSAQNKMAHTAVFSYAAGPRRRGLFAAGVESTRTVKLWDTGGGGGGGGGSGEVLSLSDAAAAEEIVDVGGWQWGHEHAMFASLTNTTVRLYDIR